MAREFQMRVRKARQAAQFAGVVQRDRNGRPALVVIPGSVGRQYEVVVGPGANVGEVKVNCALQVGLHAKWGTEPCKGSAVGVCYHEIAALLVRANGTKIRFQEKCPGKQLAFGWSVGRLHSAQSGKDVWFTFKPENGATK